MAELFVNANWGRWIFASFSKHFNTEFTSVITLFIEGQHRNTKYETDFLELRIDGPFAIQVSRGCWKLRTEISILAQSVMNDTSYHRHIQNIGTAQSAFKICIPIYKLGNGPSDDGSLLGQMKLLQNRADRHYIEAYNFGQIDRNTKLLQGTVEAHYEMELNTNEA
jgi:hypothetical protein